MKRDLHVQMGKFGVTPLNRWVSAVLISELAFPSKETCDLLRCLDSGLLRHPGFSMGYCQRLQWPVSTASAT